MSPPIAEASSERPAELLTGAQRLIEHGIEAMGDSIPSPWGPRLEFVFREIGGSIWLQITLLVLVVRIALSLIAEVWRLLRPGERQTIGE